MRPLPGRDVLRADEARAAQRLIREEGAVRAAKMMGLHDERTLRKAALREPVHPLTVAVIRLNLERQGL